MKKINKNKVQEAFVNYLLQEGQLELVLPNGTTLEVGITQENMYGDLEKQPDYCWIIASQNGRAVSIDKYNLGLRYEEKNDKFICEHNLTNEDGFNVKIFDVI